MKKKYVIINLAVILLVIGILWVLQCIMTPKYTTDILEGSMIDDYYEETTDHDVVFIGDCEVYENFSPITMWEEYGITSYIRGSAQQLIWQSYYLMEETLKYETPDVIVFNVLSMKYSEPQNEAYNRMSIDGMRMSRYKMANVKASMCEEEEAITYVFPLLRYHSRWNDLTKDDFKYAFKDPKVITHSGYLMHTEVNPFTTEYTQKRLTNYEFEAIDYEYLDKMVKLCKDNDVELVLIKAPSLYPAWYDEWDEQMVEYAQKNNLKYYNFLENTEEIGLDFSTDTYDAGLHLNVVGAEKLSKYFGKILVDECGVKDNRSDAELSKVWADKVEYYNWMKEDQYRELSEYGYLKSYGGHPKSETSDDVTDETSDDEADENSEE